MPFLQKAVDKEFGAFPAKEGARLTYYGKDAAASAIYKGDFVILESDGKVAVAAAGNTLLGVSAAYSAASAVEDIPVWDDPETIFYIQDDGAGTTPAATFVGTNADILATTGNTTTLNSKHEIDISSSTTSTANLRLISLHPVEDASYGKNRIWMVRINEHSFMTSAGV